MFNYSLQNSLDKDGSLKISVLETKSGQEQNFLFKSTYHSKSRASQRGICTKEISEVITFGEVVQKQGYDFYYLKSKKNFSSPKNRLVVVAKDDIIITSYFNTNPVKFIGKKPKMNFRRLETAA
jgi:hypothetical protein